MIRSTIGSNDSEALHNRVEGHASAASEKTSLKKTHSKAPVCTACIMMTHPTCLSLV